MLIEFIPKSYPTNLIVKDWTKRKTFFRLGTQELFDQVHDFEVREDDIWIVTLPKCGTTWMQEMVWLLVNNLDFERAKNEPQELRSPFLEFSHLLGEDSAEHFESLKTLPGPRVMKSHFPLPLLPKQIWTKKPKSYGNFEMEKSVEFVPKSYPSDLIEKDWNDRKIYFRHGGEKFLNQIHDFEVFEDDIWIVTLPKCGTTWMQEMVWLLVNNCDFDGAKSEPLELRSPFLEFCYFISDNYKEDFEKIGAMKRPRVIKSHFPLPLLPKQIWSKKPKLIYVFRNPKDAVVSAYYFRQNFGSRVDQTLTECVEYELSEEIRTNSLWNHVLEFYGLRNENWVHYTSFERMKIDLRREIEGVCSFLNIKINDEQMGKMLKHLSFEEMKNNPQCNHIYEIEAVRKKRGIVDYKDSRFMRKGKVGSHKEELPADVIAKLDKWIDDGLRPHNLTLNDLLFL